MKPVYVPYYVYNMSVDLTFDLEASFYDPESKSYIKVSKENVATTIDLDDKNQEMNVRYILPLVVLHFAPRRDGSRCLVGRAARDVRWGRCEPLHCMNERVEVRKPG